MGLAAGRWLNIAVPQTDKQLLAIIETDGCAFDGISVAGGCYIGRRTAWLRDFGKVAATFIDTHTGRAVRVIPNPTVRIRAIDYAPEAKNRWEGYLLGYQRMPEEALLTMQPVELTLSIEALISQAHYRVHCQVCGEEIINQREVVQPETGLIRCRACAGEQYYRHLASAIPLPFSYISETTINQNEPA